MNSRKSNVIPIAMSVLLMTSIFSMSPTMALDKGTESGAQSSEVVVVDNDKKVSTKVEASSQERSSEPSEDTVEKMASEQEKVDEAMIKAVNEVDGVEVDQDKFEKEKGFQLKHLNPFHWVFKPVTDMQERVVHLEKQIMRLEAPIASLQKPMVGLRQDMGQVDTKLDTVGDNMSKVNSHMQGVNGRMQSVNTQMGHVQTQLDKIYEPVVELQNPVSNVSRQLSTLKKDLTELKDVVSLTSTLILIAVVAVGLLICVGTPIAALFAWRHRRFIIEKLGKGDYEDVDMAEEKEKVSV